AATCIDLLSNDYRCQCLGTAANQTASQHYDRANVIQLIQNHVQAALETDLTVNVPSLATY
ncbi:MAG: glycosyltransferase, partial [Cyanobacteria bacterium J06649_12]